MKTWKKLSGVGVLCAFLVCTFFIYTAFASDSSALAQGNQASPSKGAAKSPTTSAKASSSTKTPAPPISPIGPNAKTLPPPPPPPPPPPFPLPPPLDPNLEHKRGALQAVVPPTGMIICTYTNSQGVLMAIIVPAGSTCYTHPNGYVTVTFPDGTTYTVSNKAVGGVFYTTNYDPIIIVPYYSSTVTEVPGYYRVVFPNGSVYMLPIYTSGTLWLFPPAPLPLQVPLVKPPTMMMFVFTNSYGEQVAILAPAGTTFHLNGDGSVTVYFPDGHHIDIPNSARNGSFMSQWGWPAIVVPYYGTTITNYGPLGYYFTFSDGSSSWVNWTTHSYPPQPTTTTVPLGLGLAPATQKYRFWTYFIPGVIPFLSPEYTVVGIPGIQCGFGAHGMTVTFPAGNSLLLPDPVAPGAYTATFWVDPDGPYGPQHARPVVYHYAVILVGSTVTSLGHGWYHVQAPPGYGPDFDFQYP